MSQLRPNGRFTGALRCTELGSAARMKHSFFIVIPNGFEDALEIDLANLGLPPLTRERGGFRMVGELRDAYKVCLHSRVAVRVLLPIKSFPAPNPEKLYGGVKSIKWTDHFSHQETIAIDFSSTRSLITHTQFGAQKTKDAICDQLRSVSGDRPSVNLISPDVRINVYVHEDVATVSIDLSGESLHLRGYRGDGVFAPLKENLAAAILLLLKWPQISEQPGATLFDPMCGSGTFLLEGALMAARVAPGTLREKFGFTRWKGHDEAAFVEVLAEAKAQERSIEHLSFVGFDADPRAVRAGSDAWKKLGFKATARFERKPFPQGVEIFANRNKTGLFVANPPYGDRLGEVESLIPLYKEMGDILKKSFIGWKAGILTGSPELMKAIGLHALRRWPLFNGPIECRLLGYEMYEGTRRVVLPETVSTQPTEETPSVEPTQTESTQVELTQAAPRKVVLPQVVPAPVVVRAPIRSRALMPAAPPGAATPALRLPKPNRPF